MSQRTGSTVSRLRSRLLPSPVLSVLLFLAWLMLNESTSVGHLLLGLGLALVLPWWNNRFRPERVRLRRWGTMLRLTGRVLADIVVSNVEVARRVLGPEAALRPVFVWVPLQIRSPHGMVALAGIVTLTPGTLSSEITADRRHLLVHALHCPDATAEAALVSSIRARYEAPLKEIFE
ncbi:MAG TPA: Na+/H+ antiporter subunit E [Rubrivivax sp.]|nr:Na+/H+ antiporter subunit E [Rubrivivax sp.]